MLVLSTIFARAQTSRPTVSHWRTTVEMGVQTGRVRPDNPPITYYSSWYYPSTYYPIRPAGNRIGLTIHATHSYILAPKLSAGLAAGVDYYNNSAFFPIAAVFQGDLTRQERRLTLFYSLEGGYALRGPNPHNKELKGGLLWSPGLGVRINKGNETAFLVSAGYKHQEAR